MSWPSWLTYSGWLTHITHQLQVERRTGKVRRPETDVLPLCHATNYECYTKQKQLFLTEREYIVSLSHLIPFYSIFPLKILIVIILWPRPHVLATCSSLI